jgi:hypothetical protein
LKQVQLIEIIVNETGSKVVVGKHLMYFMFILQLYRIRVLTGPRAGRPGVPIPVGVREYSLPQKRTDRVSGPPRLLPNV